MRARTIGHFSAVRSVSTIALMVNSVWRIVFLPAGTAQLCYAVIAREERYPERVFGDRYPQSKARVRRWVWHAPTTVPIHLLHDPSPQLPVLQWLWARSSLGNGA